MRWMDSFNAVQVQNWVEGIGRLSCIFPREHPRVQVISTMLLCPIPGIALFQSDKKETGFKTCSRLLPPCMREFNAVITQKQSTHSDASADNPKRKSYDFQTQNHPFHRALWCRGQDLIEYSKESEFGKQLQHTW